jgi:tRNA-specific 2-thiouridylase
MPGEFVDGAGRVLGTHQGLPFYTVGQRRGLGVQGEGPLYVVALDPERNQVVLGPEQALDRGAAALTGVNWVSREPLASQPGAAPIEARVKVRYAHEGTPARIVPTPTADDPTAVRVEFAQPVRAVTPGQAAVFYADDVLLGGGWIAAALR